MEKLYNLAWRDKGTGETGKGDFPMKLKTLNAIIEPMERAYPNLIHWYTPI